MSITEHPSPAEVRRRVLGLEDESQSSTYSTAAGAYDLFLVLSLDTDGGAHDWHDLYHDEEDAVDEVWEIKSQGGDACIVPLRLLVPGLPQHLNFRRLVAKAIIGFEQVSYSIVTPPAKRSRKVQA